VLKFAASSVEEIRAVCGVTPKVQIVRLGLLHSSAHAPEMKQEQAVTPQREIAPKQEQSMGIGLGL
jgi:hypothetical protein